MRAIAPLAFLVPAFCLFGSTPAFGQAASEQAQPRSVDIAGYVAEASQRFGLPESWIYAVMRTESAGRIGAVSSAGATGLMQLMPGTWTRQRARFGLGSDPFDPRDNIMAGTSYLREMYDSYGAIGMLAAYNAGPGRYQDWRDRGRPLPTETRAYVAKIAPQLQSASTSTVVMPAHCRCSRCASHGRKASFLPLARTAVTAPPAALLQPRHQRLFALEVPLSSASLRPFRRVVRNERAFRFVARQGVVWSTKEGIEA